MLASIDAVYSPLVGVRWSPARALRLARALSGDAAARPLAVRVGVVRPGPDGAPTLLPTERLAGFLDEVRPFAARFEGMPDPLAHPHLPDLVKAVEQRGAAVTVATDATRLQPGVCWALLQAGLSRVALTVTQGESRAWGPGARNVERLVAMRDANRMPRPVVTVELLLSAARPDALSAFVGALGERLPEAEGVVRLGTDARGDALARSLDRAAAAARARGLWRTAASIERARLALAPSDRRQGRLAARFSTSLSEDCTFFYTGDGGPQARGRGQAAGDPERPC